LLGSATHEKGARSDPFYRLSDKIDAYGMVLLISHTPIVKFTGASPLLLLSQPRIPSVPLSIRITRIRMSTLPLPEPTAPNNPRSIAGNRRCLLRLSH